MPGRQSRSPASTSRFISPTPSPTRRSSARRSAWPTASSSPSSGRPAAANPPCSTSRPACSAPSAGTVAIFGAPLAGLNRQAGYLFQAEALFPWKTALDNVAIGLEVAGVARSEAHARAEAWLTRVGLAGFGERYPHMLSGGQRKRVGLAQVLIRDPKILLMDEPFGPLDAQTRQIMGNLLLDLWSADRKAVLFVTHDLEEAIALSDRVVIMSAGPAARIIGDWRVPLSAPARHRRSEARARFPRAASRDLADAQGRGAQGLRADGGRVMPSRSKLLVLQLLVAVVAIGLWHMFTTMPIFGVICCRRSSSPRPTT